MVKDKKGLGTRILKIAGFAYLFVALIFWLGLAILCIAHGSIVGTVFSLLGLVCVADIVAGHAIETGKSVPAAQERQSGKKDSRTVYEAMKRFRDSPYYRVGGAGSISIGTSANPRQLKRARWVGPPTETEPK